MARASVYAPRNENLTRVDNGAEPREGRCVQPEGRLSETQPDEDRATIIAALRGDVRATDRLVARLSPVVHYRVSRALGRGGFARGPRVRQDVEDYYQEAFADLFDAGGRALDSWNPSAGRSLENYVGQRVEWFMSSRLRTRQLRLEAPAVATAAAPIEQRDSLRHVIVGIDAKWSAFGLRMFHLLFVLQVPSKEVGAELGMSCEAVDQWRCRLREFARGLLEDDPS